MSNNPFEKKIILIAGASGGIGSVLLDKLVDSGARIIAVYKNNLPMPRTNENILLVKADLQNPEEWDSLLQLVYQNHGRIDILINCIGVLIPGNFINHTEEQTTEMINTNFLSVIIGTRKALELMQENGSGHIVNLGSVGGIIPMPYSSVYCATKFALRGFTHSLANELKNTRVKISLISPGPVLTKMLEREANHSKTAIAFINKAIEPAKVADAVIKVLQKPRTEVIVPAYLSFSANVFFFFPGIFSASYNLIEKIGWRRKRILLKKQFELSLQK